MTYYLQCAKYKYRAVGKQTPILAYKIALYHEYRIFKIPPILYIQASRWILGLFHLKRYWRVEACPVRSNDPERLQTS